MTEGERGLPDGDGAHLGGFVGYKFMCDAGWILVLVDMRRCKDDRIASCLHKANWRSEVFCCSDGTASAFTNEFASFDLLRLFFEIRRLYNCFRSVWSGVPCQITLQRGRRVTMLATSVNFLHFWHTPD